MLSRISVSFLLLMAATMPARAQALAFSTGASLGTVNRGTVSFNLSATGGTAPYTYSVSPAQAAGAALPAGFRVENFPRLPDSFNLVNRGGLLGLAINSGAYSLTIRVTDSLGATADRTFNFTVSEIDIAGFMPDRFAPGEQVYIRFGAAGGVAPHTFSIVAISGTPPANTVYGLPSGVTLNGATGEIAGLMPALPAGVDRFTFDLKVTDANGLNFTRRYTQTVTPLRFDNGNRTLPNAIQGQSYAYTLSASGGTAPYEFTLEPNFSLPPGLAMSSSGVISGTAPNVTYNQVMDVRITDKGSPALTRVVRVTLSVIPAQNATPLTLNSTTYADTFPGDEFNWNWSAFGGLPPYSYSLAPGSTAPPGMAITNSTGISPLWSPNQAAIRGRMTQTGTFGFTVRVTDAAGNISDRAYTITSRGIAFSPRNLPTLALNTAMTPYNSIPYGGTPPYIVTPSEVPAGLGATLETGTGRLVISGTPLESGIDRPWRFRLQDSGGQSYINNGFVTIPSGTAVSLQIDGGDFGTFSSGFLARNIGCNGGTSVPLTPTIVSGTLPPGFALLGPGSFNPGVATNLMGQLAASATTPGSYSLLLRCTDGAGNLGQRLVRFRVSALAYVTTGLPQAYVGQPYSAVLDVRGGTAPYAFTTTNGPMPPGLTLNPSTGAITGTPTSQGAYTVTYQATDVNGDALPRSYTMNIYPFPITTPNLLPNAIFGQPYSVTLTTPQPGVTWTLNGTPPTGMTFTPAGVLSGTPLTTGLFNLSINAGTGSLTAVKNFSLFIRNLAIQNTLTAITTSGITEFVTGTPTLSVLALATSSGTPPVSVSVVGGALPPGLSIMPTDVVAGINNYTRPAVAGVATASGLYTARLRFQDAAGVVVERPISFRTHPISLSSPAPATVNQPYQFQLAALPAGPAYTYTLVSQANNVLPPGMTLSPSGLLSGTPLATGTFGLTLAVSDGVTTRNIFPTVTVNALGATQERIDISTLSADTTDLILGNCCIGELIPTGGTGPYTWSVIGSLPPGMSLLAGATRPSTVGANSAYLAGSPTAEGVYTFRIRVDDAFGNFGIRQARLNTLAMRNTPINTYTRRSSLLPGRVGVPYSMNIGLLNARAPITWTPDVFNALPPGITFTAAGVLAGTPTDAGNFTFSYFVTDADGKSRRLALGMTIMPADKAINSSITSFQNFPSATVGQPYSFVLNDLRSPGWGTPSTSFAVTGGALPPGLGVTPPSGTTSALVTGTPTTPGTYTFSFTATDANGLIESSPNNTIIVTALGVAPAAGSLPPAVAGTAYSQTLTASGGTPPYLFAFNHDSDRPAGLTLSSGGSLSGTPVYAGSWALFIKVTDAANNTFLQRYVFDVSPAGTVIPAITAAPTSVSVPYTAGAPAPAAIPLAVGSTAGSFAYTIAASTSNGGNWLSVASGAGTAPTSASILVTPGALAPGTYFGAITITSAAVSNSPLVVPVQLQVSAAQTCTYSLSGPATMPAAGATANLTLTTQPGCAWTGSSNAAWLRLSAVNGTGTSTPSVTADPNPGTATRTGTVTLAGRWLDITQFGTACQFTLSSPSASVSAAGGNGAFQLLASSSSCAWTATPANFVSLTGPTSGTGGAQILFNVPAYGGASSRSATITAGGQAFVINQQGVGCTYSLNTSSVSVPATGGAVNVSLTAPAGCAWTADFGPNWIQPSGTTFANGNGSASFGFQILPNSFSNARQAAIVIAGTPVTVTEAGVPCSLSLGPVNTLLSAAGGSGSVAVTASAPSCLWIATPGDSWLSLNASSGTGSGNVVFTAPANAGAQSRSTQLTIGGQPITIQQAGATCQYQLRSPSASVGAASTASSVGIVTPPGCAWSAVSNAPWLTLAGGANGNGAADVAFNVAENTTAQTRSGTLTLAGITFAVTQAAAPCVVTLGSTSLNASGLGSTASLTYTTSVAGCAPPVSSNTSFLVITNQTYASNTGQVDISIQPNPYGVGRSGVIRVGPREFTVNQAPSPCVYTLPSYGETFGAAGAANASFGVNYSPAACGPPAVGVNGPPGMITLGPIQSQGASLLQVNYTLGLYQSLLNYVRTAQIVVSGGQIYTVKQRSY